MTKTYKVFINWSTEVKARDELEAVITALDEMHQANDELENHIDVKEIKKDQFPIIQRIINNLRLDDFWDKEEYEEAKKLLTSLK